MRIPGYLLLPGLLVALLGRGSHAAASPAQPYAYAPPMHVGEVYQVEPLDAERFVTLGEDQKLAIWSASDGRHLDDRTFGAELADRHVYRFRMAGSRAILLSRPVSGNGDAALHVLDLESGELAPPVRVAGGPVADFTVDAGSDQVLLALAGQPQLLAATLAGSVTRRWALPGPGSAICRTPGPGNTVYVGTITGQLVAVSPDDDALRTTELGRPVTAVACGSGGLVFAAHGASGIISRIPVERPGSPELLSTGDQGGSNGSLALCAGGNGDVYAAGSLEREQVIQLVRIAAGSSVVTGRTGLGTNTVLGLGCLPGRVMAATADPAIFLVDENLSPAAGSGPVTADFRQIGPRLGYEPASGTVHFATRYGGRATASFSFAGMALQPSDSGYTDGGYLACDTAMALVGQTGERVTGRCLAASRRESRLVVATDWLVHRFELDAGRARRAGEPIRSRVRIYGIALAGDQFVTASSDGALRWFDWSAGDAKLTLFVHRNGRSWAAWNSSGQYAASADLEPDLRVLDRQSGRYLPVDGQRARFSTSLRPDEPPAAGGGAAPEVTAGPPGERVRIVAPRSGARLSIEEIVVEVAVARGASPSQDVVLVADGRPVSMSRGIATLFTARELPAPPAQAGTAPAPRPPGSAGPGTQGASKPTVPKGPRAQASPGWVTRRFAVVVPYGTTELVAKVSDAGRTYHSRPVKLYWAEARKPAPQAAPPRLVYLGIGVSDYQEADLDLRYPNKDATDLLGALGSTRTPVVSRVLADASRASVESGFDWLLAEARPEDLAVIFLAGHGVTFEDEFFYLPADARTADLRGSALGEGYFRSRLGRLPGRTLMLVDACHSGELGRASGLRIEADRPALELRDAGQSIVVFSSSSGRQLSQENPAWENGAFTEALLEALGPRGDALGRRFLTIRDLEYYVSRRVADLTGSQQTPVMAVPPGVPDYRVLDL